MTDPFAALDRLLAEGREALPTVENWEEAERLASALARLGQMAEERRERHRREEAAR